jgi:hypothetical protein
MRTQQPIDFYQSSGKHRFEKTWLLQGVQYFYNGRSSQTATAGALWARTISFPDNLKCLILICRVMGRSPHSAVQGREILDLVPRQLKPGMTGEEHYEAPPIPLSTDLGRRFRYARCNPDWNDEWLNPTLLGATFDAGNAEKAQELVEQVAIDGHANWKLVSTLDDCKTAAVAGTPPQRSSRYHCSTGSYAGELACDLWIFKRTLCRAARPLSRFLWAGW